MAEWQEYRRIPGDRRWQNRYGDTVQVRDMLCTDEPVVTLGERYHARYRPAQSDVVSTVPNGRFAAYEDAVQYAINVVMQGDTVTMEDSI